MWVLNLDTLHVSIVIGGITPPEPMLSLKNSFCSRRRRYRLISGSVHVVGLPTISASARLASARPSFNKYVLDAIGSDGMVIVLYNAATSTGGGGGGAGGRLPPSINVFRALVAASMSSVPPVATLPVKLGIFLAVDKSIFLISLFGTLLGASPLRNAAAPAT